MKLMVPCAEFDAVSFEPNDGSIEFLNIEEDFDGTDVATFVCPVCGEVHKSRVYG